MSGAGKIKLDPLFVGLTRPPLFFGVSLSFSMLNMMASTIYYINFTDLRVILLAIAIHGIGYVICFKEPLFIELFKVKTQNCNKSPNVGFHGANSYDMF